MKVYVVTGFEYDSSEVLLVTVSKLEADCLKIATKNFVYVEVTEHTVSGTIPVQLEMVV